MKNCLRKKGVMSLIDNMVRQAFYSHITARVVTKEYTITPAELTEGRLRFIELQRNALTESVGVLRELGLSKTAQAILCLVKPTADYFNQVADIGNAIITNDKELDRSAIEKECEELLERLKVDGDKED